MHELNSYKYLNVKRFSDR